MPLLCPLFFPAYPFRKTYQNNPPSPFAFGGERNPRAGALSEGPRLSAAFPESGAFAPCPKFPFPSMLFLLIFGRSAITMKLAGRPFGGKLFKEVLFMAYVISSDCIACGACEGECPVGAISNGGDKYVINPDLCIECGACAGVCPMGAPVKE